MPKLISNICVGNFRHWSSRKIYESRGPPQGRYSSITRISEHIPGTSTTKCTFLLPSSVSSFLRIIWWMSMVKLNFIFICMIYCGKVAIYYFFFGSGWVVGISCRDLCLVFGTMPTILCEFECFFFPILHLKF